MRLKYFIRRICLLCCLLLIPLLTGCDLLPNLSFSPTNQTPTTSLNVWTQAAPGVQVRSETWQSPSNHQLSDTVSIVRFDLHNVTLSVAYQPNQPLSMQQWMQKEQAVALMNGGYFDSNDNATALVISNGQRFGTSYSGFGGMLYVDGQGNIHLRSLSAQPYDPSEGITQATQCAPMLMVNGQRPPFDDSSDKASPRSVAAIDKQGHLLLIASPDMDFTLADMATLLSHSDLNLVNALNLDGGSSTGLFVNAGSQSINIDSYVNLPLVIVVKEK